MPMKEVYARVDENAKRAREEREASQASSSHLADPRTALLEQDESGWQSVDVLRPEPVNPTRQGSIPRPATPPFRPSDRPTVAATGRGRGSPPWVPQSPQAKGRGVDSKGKGKGGWPKMNAHWSNAK